MTSISVKCLGHAQGLPLPCRMTPGSSGCDVCAAIEGEVVVNPGERALIPTGLVMEIPLGLEVQVRPRSGLAIRHGITVLNAPGTIDADYRGEVQIILINHGREPFTIHRGDRIAQLVAARVETDVAFVPAESVTQTRRGEGGFGHSGVR